jgi:hypothetical protein
VNQNGNQCALITESFAPCRMEMAGDTADLDRCELNGSARAIDIATFKRVEFKKED